MDHRTLNDLTDELSGALAELGLAARVEAGNLGPEGFGEAIVELDGRMFQIRVASRSDLRPVHADALAPLTGADAGMVFADRIGERSREVLRERGWGWFDRRRGRVRIWCRGLRLDAEITPTILGTDTRVAANAFSPAGRKVVLWLLTHPDEHASPRALSREVGVSAGQVSTLLRTLSDEALLRKDRRPLVPELFWALADHWKPQRHALVSMPGPSELAESKELRADRWVVSDTRAALHYGAPVVAAPEYPPDFYVPDERSLSWLLSRSVRAAEWGQRTATVAVAPTPLVCDPRLRTAGDPWPLAHPVVVALDLAVDKARGREVLEHWDPLDETEVRRVW